jgi:uncharacterized OB-fold protein
MSEYPGPLTVSHETFDKIADMREASRRAQADNRPRIEALSCPECGAPIKYGSRACEYCRVCLVGVPEVKMEPRLEDAETALRIAEMAAGLGSWVK